MTTRYEELERLAKEASQEQWCKDYCYSAIRHVERNCDIECLSHGEGEECSRGFGQYDGPYVAAACPETILSLLTEHKQALELLRERRKIPCYACDDLRCDWCRKADALLSPVKGGK